MLRGEQELLAAQLIRAFADIFADSGLPLQLRPYEVLVTSNRTALIQLVPDSLSIHQARPCAHAPRRRAGGRLCIISHIQYMSQT